MKLQKKHTIKAMFFEALFPALFLVFLCCVLIAVGNVTAGQKKESKQRMEDTIKKAVINCYAIEGRYPATLEYVEEYYGLQIDKEQYTVFYEVFADNIMPEITVLTK